MGVGERFMSEDGTRTEKRGGALRRLTYGLLVLLTLASLVLFSLANWLNGSRAPAVVSRLVSDRLGQPFRVERIHVDAVSVSLTGVVLANPADSGPGELIRVRSLTAEPDWGELLLGRRSLRVLSLEGVRVDLRRNEAGVWNFSRLQRLLSAGKGGELHIDRCRLSGGAFLVNGRGVEGLALQLADLSTRGSDTARFRLSFQDPGRNRYTLTGQARPGRVPELDLTLSAPAVSPAALSPLLGQRGISLSDTANVALNMTADLRGARLRLRGRADFKELLPAAAGKGRLNGTLELAAVYDGAADRARLESLRLTSDGRLGVTASATVDAVRSRRRFTADLRVTHADLSVLAPLLPPAERGKTIFGGTLHGQGLHLAGDGRSGVTEAAGDFRLRDAWLTRGGHPLLTRLNTTLTLGRAGSRFLLRGNLSRADLGDDSLLESLEAPFTITLSNRLALVGIRAPLVTARGVGCELVGRFGFTPAAAAPLSATLRVSAPSLSRLTPFLEPLPVRLESGQGTLSLRAAGRGVHDFGATASLRLTALRGNRAGERFGVGEGRLESRLVRNRKGLSARGSLRLAGIGLGKGRGEGRAGFTLDAGRLTLSDGAFLWDGTALSLVRLVADIPHPLKEGGTVRYPLSARVGGASVRHGAGEVSGVSGAVSGSLLSDGRGRWLEGRGELAAGLVAWRGMPLASPRLRLSLGRTKGEGELGGALLGGTLNATIGFDPSQPRRGGTFRASVAGVRLARTAVLFPAGGSAVPADGLLDGAVSGGYSPGEGVTCRFNATGRGISARGRGGKTLLSKGGFSLEGSLSRERLVIPNLRLTAGAGPSLAIAGEMARPLTPQREGRFNFVLPRIPLNDLIDPFVNLLPRFIQEAVVGGSLDLRGGVAVAGGKRMLDGTLGLEGVKMEVPSQALKISGVNGRVPFSLDLSGSTPPPARDATSFTRENYPRILERLRAQSGGVQTLTVAGVSFGPLALGSTGLTISATEGVTRIVSLSSTLYEGALLGAGHLTLARGLSYRGDLLLSGLSLKRLCASIPRITDYISGRVDGVISVSGVGTAAAGMTGFGQLWAREGGGEKMLVSREFLQKLSGKKLSGFFFRSDRPFDQAVIAAQLEKGYLTFESLDLSHTNLFGVRDLSVTISPGQNRIALDHLFNSIREATTRGKAATGGEITREPVAEPEFKWDE